MKNTNNVMNSDSPILGISMMIILGALMAITSLSTDIYLPSMPKMAIQLQGDIELTVTGFLLGFAIAQLFWGPISDAIGRKKPLMIGMILFIIGSVGCALSQNIYQIVFWRVFQAFGACTGPMLARAMIRDLYGKIKAAQMLSSLTMIMAIAPIIGPLLGGQIIRFTTWHAIFWLLVLIGIVMMLSILFLPETKVIIEKEKISLKNILKDYFQLLMNHKFMFYVLCLTFYYAAAIVYIMLSPFIYISHFHIDEQHYGWFFAINIVGLIFMSMINRHLVQKYSLNLLLIISSVISLTALIILLCMMHFQMVGLIDLIISILLFFSMNGILAATATALALDQISSKVGSASALVGSFQYGSGILSSLMLIFFNEKTPFMMIAAMVIFCALSFLMAVLASLSTRSKSLNSI